MRGFGFAIGLLGGLILAASVEAGQTAAAGSPAAMSPSVELPFGFDGPAPPVAPDVITRDADGRATVRAVRLTSPIRLDGQLDEAIYTTLPPIEGFIQVEPSAGSPLTEKTEAWLTFDRDQVYVSAAGTWCPRASWRTKCGATTATSIRTTLSASSSTPSTTAQRRLLRGQRDRGASTGRSRMSASSTPTGIPSGTKVGRFENG
jgi:hypothetical protein